MSGIDSDEISQVCDRIDEAGKPVWVYLDEEGKVRTKIVNQTNKRTFQDISAYKVVGIYDIATSFRDLKADVEYVRAM